MKINSFNITILFIISGVLVVFSSIVMTYLDSIGFWGYPKDFMLALFRNRSSEPVGLGVQGLQIFHYLVGGFIFLLLGLFSSVEIQERSSRLRTRGIGNPLEREKTEAVVKTRCRRCGALNEQNLVFCRLCNASLIVTERVMELDGILFSQGTMVNDVKKDIKNLKKHFKSISNQRKEMEIIKKTPKISQIEDPDLLGKVYAYLENYRKTSLSGIARDLHLSIPKVEQAISELDKLGRIRLQ